MTRDDTSTDGITRRTALAAGVAGAAAVALPVIASAASSSSGTARADKSADDTWRTAVGAPRLPVIYLPHGGGPWPFVDVGFGEKRELDALATYLKSIGSIKPRALLVISAHWEARVPTVMNSAQPPMLYDYYGFPPESYTITWPAPGAPALAAEVRALLEGAGFNTDGDGARGYDHGTFVPLKLAYPDADVPVVQLSLVDGLDPAAHLAMGRALAPLRDRGVLIVGSGMSFHNMRGFGARGRPASEAFDAWLGDTMKQPRDERERRLTAWASAPGARESHPREEHLLPLMVVAGAAGDDAAVRPYNETLMGVRVSAFQLG